MEKSIFDIIVEEIMKNEVDSPRDKEAVLANINRLKKQKLNILFVGATGVGKSSTINAIFNTEIAKVGYSTDPETMSIQKYEMGNLILWDSPGLGDNPEMDKKYAREIINALKEKDADGQLVIDEAVVLIDGSNRDMRTAYEIIEKIVLPYIGNEERMVIAVNQCDMALKGRHWNYDACQPEGQLVDFLEQKVCSVKERIMESTGVCTKPFYYSAYNHYNISKLLLAILGSIPEEKRVFVADNLNKNPNIWQKNDELENYNKEITGSIQKALEGAAAGAVAGATVGRLIPVIGPPIGAALGAVLGFLGGLVG